MITSLVLIVAALAFLGWVRSLFSGPKHGEKSSSGLHGSADWMTGDEKERLVTPSGLVVGVVDINDNARLLRYSEPGPSLVVGSPRSGKGAGYVIPILLTHCGPVYCTDPKMENFAVCARARRALGQRAVAYAPFGPGPHWNINPLDWVRRDDNMIGDVMEIACSLIALNPKDPKNHFDNSARDILKGFILYILLSEAAEKQNLVTVYRCFISSPRVFNTLLEEMSSHENTVVAKAANKLLSCGQDERGSHMSTMTTALGWLDEPRVARSISSSDFSFEEIMDGKLALFLCIPHEKMDLFRPLLRLLGELPVKTVMRAGRKPAGGDLLCIWDELAQLHYSEAVEKTCEVATGLGVRPLAIFQDIGQIKKNYPNPQTFLSAPVKIWLGGGIQDIETSKYVSESLGKQTRIQISRSSSRSSGGQRNKSESSSVSEVGVPLMQPDEITRMEPAYSIVELRGQRPAMMSKALYYDARVRPLWQGADDPNPYQSENATAIWQKLRTDAGQG